jgi:hypothetical protein
LATVESGAKCAAANKRFGATTAGNADLKGSEEKPPLRQAATTLERKRESAMLLRKTLNEKKFFLTELAKFEAEKRKISNRNSKFI